MVRGHGDDSLQVQRLLLWVRGLSRGRTRWTWAVMACLVLGQGWEASRCVRGMWRRDFEEGVMSCVPMVNRSSATMTES